MDRDGVINEYPGDFRYVTSWQEFRFLPGAAKAIEKLIGAGFAVFVVSNQAGVSKGLYTRKTLDSITGNMKKKLAGRGVRLAKVYYCIHQQEDNCSCRKPKTGLISQAINEVKKQGGVLKISESYFIGDSIIDVQTGKAAGLKTILVFSGREKPGNRKNWPVMPDFTADNLSKAADLITK